MMKRFIGAIFLAVLMSACGGDEVAKPASPNGTAGSTARFCAFNDVLYVVTNRELKVYAIEADGSARFENTMFLGNGLETIFRHDSILYIGAIDGMYLYDIRNPFQPKPYAKFLHFVARDPVVSDGRLAFVTLRNPSNWNGSAQGGALQVVDVSDPTLPFLLTAKQMNAPKGLALHDSLLLVCDEGIKMYKVDASLSLPLLKHIQMEAEDVVVVDGVAMVIGKDGLYQYELRSDLSMRLLSKISTKIP
ncbi:MAG: hypothetical protein Q8J69_11775 [Sphingobacteriaceae bacterium]|nr:hypothetical protein [Sphingobacteriaceae bacterium]